MGEIQRLIRHCSFHRQRIFRVRTNPLDYLNETEVIERCRLPRVFCRLIDLVNEDVERPTRRSHPLPTSKQVLKYCGARVRHLLHVHICDTLKEFLATLKNPLKNWITYTTCLIHIFSTKKLYIHCHQFSLKKFTNVSYYRITSTGFFPSLSVHFQRQLFSTTRFVSSSLTHMKVVFLIATEI